ncbi:YtxH domain-containing protein [Pedobacter boryungensis]|nr:YtxH domain-containing protein [Pedobacter boryungensis]
MKYGKLIGKILSQKSNNNGQVAVAIVAGLAAGAIISMLFAPESGKDARKLIGDRAKGLGSSARDTYAALRNKIVGNDFEEHKDGVAPEVPHFVRTPVKKRKSDIRDIIHESHVEEQHTNQSTN